MSVRFPAFSALFALALASGCAKPHFDRDFDYVRPGMPMSDVARTAGEPERKWVGDDLNLGKQVWYYEKGEIHFDGPSVESVLRHRGDDLDEILGPRLTPEERARLELELRNAPPPGR